MVDCGVDETEEIVEVVVGLRNREPSFEHENVVLLEAWLVPEEIGRVCLTECGSGAAASSSSW
jgi:hypothetical protein